MHKISAEYWHTRKPNNLIGIRTNLLNLQLAKTTARTGEILLTLDTWHCYLWWSQGRPERTLRSKNNLVEGVECLHTLPFLTGFYISPGSFRETSHNLCFYNTSSFARSAEQTTFSDEIICIKTPLKLHSLKYGNLSRLCAFLDTDCFNRKKLCVIWPPFQLLWSFVDTGKIFLSLMLGLVDIIWKYLIEWDAEDNPAGDFPSCQEH